MMCGQTAYAASPAKSNKTPGSRGFYYNYIYESNVVAIVK